MTTPLIWVILLFCVGAVGLFRRGILWRIRTSFIKRWEIYTFRGTSLNRVLLVRWDRLLLGRVVSLISSIVLIFRIEYIRTDPHPNRFTLTLLLFIIRILALIFGVDLITILLGWDGLGLTSFALVIFYQNETSLRAGLITALRNRIGDARLIITIGLIVPLGRFSAFYMGDLREFTAPLLILTRITKRAQIPFSAWLPAAIAAPTPVSALVHSSTLVTAGIYLLYRFFNLLPIEGLRSLKFLGRITIIISGIGASLEKDIKKVIALSTLRQLGVIVISLGCNLPLLAYFHLLRHALFKALLFLRVGVFIHSMFGGQDFRLGGCRNVPLTTRILLICNISLRGIPFLSGFYSKDLILEVIILSRWNLLTTLLIILGVGLTFLYSLRLTLHVLRKETFSNLNIDHLELDKLIYWPLTSLSLGAVIGGRFLRWTTFEGNYTISLPLFWKLAALILIGLVLFLLALNPKESQPFFSPPLYFNNSIWFIPLLFNGWPLLGLSKRKAFISLSDRGWSQQLGPSGLYTLLIWKCLISFRNIMLKPLREI